MKKIITLLIGVCLFKAGFPQNVGIGTTLPKSRLDLNGDLAQRSADITIAATYTYALDVNTVKQSQYKLKAAAGLGNFILAGIAMGSDGRMITLTNRTGASMEIYNEDATALAANRIQTATGNTIAVYPNGSVTLRYDVADGRWLVKSAHNNSLDNFGQTTPSQLEKITENGKTGWRLLGKNPANYGDIGEGAVDLSDVIFPSDYGATGNNSFAVGRDVTAEGIYSAAIGYLANARGFTSFAVGLSADAIGQYSTAIGPDATASGQNSTAIGTDATASGQNSTAMGTDATASGEYSTAMGYFSSTNEKRNSFVINGSSGGSGLNITKNTADYQMMMNFDEYIF